VIRWLLIAAACVASILYGLAEMFGRLGWNE
jgi:hypothetical protein